VQVAHITWILSVGNMISSIISITNNDAVDWLCRLCSLIVFT